MRTMAQGQALNPPPPWYSCLCAGVTVKPGDWVYADGDGVLVSPEPLT
jgi:hypothetical protein